MELLVDICRSVRLKRLKWSLCCKYCMFLYLHGVFSSFFSTASVQLPWQRAVSQNKVPYYIKWVLLYWLVTCWLCMLDESLSLCLFYGNYLQNNGWKGCVCFFIYACAVGFTCECVWVRDSVHTQSFQLKSFLQRFDWILGSFHCCNIEFEVILGVMSTVAHSFSWGTFQLAQYLS